MFIQANRNPNLVQRYQSNVRTRFLPAADLGELEIRLALLALPGDVPGLLP
jgi:hypothetical protein